MAKLTYDQIINGVDTCSVISIDNVKYRINSCEVDEDGMVELLDENSDHMYLKDIDDLMERDVKFFKLGEVDPSELV